jgi:formate hydrogenlyase subunit 3/multisubunit Na+/H+ antiporter MnhD subunit
LSLLVAALALWAGGAALGLLSRGDRAARAIGLTAALAGSAAGLAAALGPLAGGPVQAASARWAVPFGALSLSLDPLAATFLAPVCVVGGLGAIYGAAYLAPHADTHPAGPRFAAYNLLLASMALVVTAANPLLLLFGWEGMTLASWALVVSDHETLSARRAGQLYLVAAHVATAALIVFFLALPSSGGWALGGPAGARAALPAGTMFALALVGFGTKAGIVPFHVWLPDAHSAAPGHVSALMSGVMITMGFYGLARFLPQTGAATAGTAAVLIVLGAAGAAGAIAHALVQRDVKRMLAYSTVENAGLVALAMGCALLAEAAGRPQLASLAWTAALLHLWNHAIFKSLLFLGVGAAARATGSRDLESWGGLAKRWPLAGALMSVGGAGLAGLPPFGGFVSEWLILATLFAGALALHGMARAAMVLGVGVVAGTAALALAAGVRLVGIGWLGSPRSPATAAAPAPRGALTLPMLALAALSLFAGLAPGVLVRALSGAVGVLTSSGAAGVVRLAAPLALVAALLLAVSLALLLLRAAVTRGRVARRSVTWDCGYAHPGPSMQYTGASLSEPLARQLAPVLRMRVRWSGLGGLWPASASWNSQALDRAITDVYQPLTTRLSGALARLRELQEPHVTTHLRYMVLALLVALALLFVPIRVGP